jgi:anti-sigma factor RsiW
MQPAASEPPGRKGIETGWQVYFQRHCSDETLISHLDGELPFYARTPVRRHLERCWRCRLRLSEVESQVLSVTRAMERDIFPGPERAAEARLSFLRQADRIADEVFCRQAAKRRFVPGRALVWAAAAVVLLAIVSVWTGTRRDTRPVALTTMNRVEAAGRCGRCASPSTSNSAGRRADATAGRSAERRLEVWSDPAQGRFATAFRDGRGGVQHAVWQPRPIGSTSIGRLARRRSPGFRERGRQSWDLLHDGMTPGDLESGLLTWLENRSWQRRSRSPALASLASSDGATLKAGGDVSGAGRRCADA